MMQRWMRGLVGAAAVLLAAAPAAAACKLGVMATLPITMQGLRPTTVAQINGVDEPFLVDSGAFYSIITPGSARQFGLNQTPVRVGFYIRGIGGDTIPTITNVRRFGIAGQTLNNIQFLVGGSEVGQDNGGVIGYNVLGLGDTEYDLAHGSIRLIKSAGCTRAAFPFWKDGTGSSEVALDASVGGRTNRILSSATINGVKIRVQFDTGAAGSVVSRAAALRAGIDVAALKPTGTSTGFGKRAVKSWLVPVDVFKIGEEEVHKTYLRVIDMIWDGADAPEMLLGADFFLSHISMSRRSCTNSTSPTTAVMSST